tara:strand:+ start:3345 stop:4100 length:756 start_codon:yes stop_codon:yes gene_type:complete
MKKTILAIGICLSLNSYSQPKPKPVESVRLANNILYQTISGIETQRGSVTAIVPDVNRNIITGLEVVIDSRSTNNFITADNARITNSHNNILNAKNVIIENSSGCRIDGADHTIKNSPYCSVDNDANWVENAESSSTSGTGNKNYCSGGSIRGNNNRLGTALGGFYNSTITGDVNIIEGSNSHITGSFIKIIGNNVIVIGSGTPGNILLFTTPGVHIVNQISAIAAPIQSVKGRYAAYDQMGRLLYLVKIQ